jgi:ribosome-associated protein
MSAVARLRHDKETPRKGAASQPVDSGVAAQLQRVVSILEDYKAVNITVLPLAGQASFADFMVVASGTSTRHVASMGQALHDKMARDVLGMEGLNDGEWVCADMGAVVVHVFVPEKRTLYNLEKLWSHVFEVADDAVPH